MNNPFKQKPAPDKPNRNTFDLSFNNNLTLNIGGLYPVMCKEVIPGDSFNINTSFGLRFMPLAFPVQTRLRADVHFFYVRNRNLWKDWQDFYTRGKEGLSMPRIQTDDASKFATGSLADYLGIPTTVSADAATNSLIMLDSNKIRHLPSKADFNKPQILQVTELFDTNQKTINSVGNFTCRLYPTNLPLWRPNLSNTSLEDLPNELMSYQGIPPTATEWIGTTQSEYQYVKVTDTTKITLTKATTAPTRILVVANKMGSLNNENRIVGAFDTSFASLNGNMVSSQTCNLITGYRYYNATNEGLTLQQLISKLVDNGQGYKLVFLKAGTYVENAVPTAGTYYDFGSYVYYNKLVVSTTQDAVNVSQPYLGANPAIPINALPFRAYEAIYNGFYRNQQVDPFRIGGVPEYNKFNTNLNAGADSTTPLDINYRYYEDDVFTTALPSPQQGTAPLVGVRNNGLPSYKLQTEIGGTPTEIIVQANQEEKVTAVSHYNTDIPSPALDALNEAINIGISINDFRNVNSLQRWLEKNNRRGFRYKDQILTHFGVNVSFEELDMPEFLGGVTEDVKINSVTNTTDSSEAVLGSYAGQAHCFGQAKHTINKYFDEPGYVIALLSVVPIPTYSQTLPKHFTKFSNLDYFFPSFNHIGFQPITAREIAPLQAVYAQSSLDDTFGYQRPWYDYLASLDEAHGDMRLSLRDFLINRVFGSVPQLGKDFLSIYPEDVNDVFTVREGNEHKIVGQVYFDIKAKRPISRFAEGRID